LKNKSGKGRHKPLTDFLKKPSATQPSQQAQPLQPQPQGEAGGGEGSNIEDIVKLLTESKKQRKTPQVKEESVEPKPKISRELLEKIAANQSLKRLECDNNGVCKDGIRVGEKLVDEYGIERKRGFLNTTRLPIFLDWVSETASVERLTDRTFVVKTERGALAVVPDHFICELQYRYGITIPGLDEKCKDYKPSIGRQYKPRSRRKK
jgi:hypothetical protein